MRSVNVAWSHLKIGAANELQYRVNFFIRVLQSGISLVVGLVSLALVFSYTQNLGGWTHAELLIVMGIYMAMGGIISTFIQPNMDRLLSEILYGGFDFALMKPVDSQLMVSIREVNFWSLTDLIVGLAVVAFGIVQLGNGLSAWQIASFVGTILLGAVLLYCFWLIVTSIAFWVIRLGDFFLIFQAIYAAGRWPVGIYPTWLRLALTFLVPVAFAITVPAEALTGRLGLMALLGALATTILFVGLARFIWRQAIRRYSGASG